MSATAIGWRPAGQGRWLVTLADLSLLLVGFLVVVHAAEKKGPQASAALNHSVRRALDGDADIALAVNAVAFSSGSVAPVGDLAAMGAWARNASADPRSHLQVTAHGRGADGLVLAARRAEAVAASLRRGEPAARVGVTVDDAGPADRVDVSVSFGSRP